MKQHVVNLDFPLEAGSAVRFMGAFLEHPDTFGVAYHDGRCRIGVCTEDPFSFLAFARSVIDEDLFSSLILNVQLVTHPENEPQEKK